ncbi:hypothetical protein ACFDR9_000562 [Janthinobacterium sp. CG_23.3]|uniref:hypothetical protein n=1 Tax=Janthinobacterium sp. CG_23.3 TaxID=3349634 RepID=UPI0038D367D7
MTNPLIDSTAVIAELRTLSRGSLLIIAERAIELIPADQLHVLIGDFVELAATAGRPSQPTQTLLDQAREFFDAAMAGHYYGAVEINNRGRQEQSAGTDAFVAEFDRLLRRCLGASATDMKPGLRGSSAHEVRDSFELFFALLRHIDEGNDEVLAFSDDGSSLDVGVNWRVVLPAYFECLAETEASSPEEFTRAVDKAIAEFGGHDRSLYIDAARAVANAAQSIALMRR